MDWIVGLQKAARNPVSGLSADQLEQVAGDTGPWPEELRSLYGQLDGGEFSGGASLFPAGTISEKSRDLLPGTAYPGSLRLGERGPKQLFASRKTSLSPGHLHELPSWWDSVDDDAWVYGARNEQTGETRLYKTLQHLLSVHIPPAETEEFGERTYARAMSLVQGALDSLKEGAGAVVERVTEVTESITEDAEKFAEETKAKMKAVGRKLKSVTKRKPTRAKKAAASAKKPAKAAPRRSPAKVTPKKSLAKRTASGAPKKPKRVAAGRTAGTKPKAKTARPTTKKARAPSRASASKRTAAKKKSGRR